MYAAQGRTYNSQGWPQSTLQTAEERPHNAQSRPCCAPLRQGSSETALASCQDLRRELLSLPPTVKVCIQHACMCQLTTEHTGFMECLERSMSVSWMYTQGSEPHFSGPELTHNEDSTDSQWQALLVLQAGVQHAIPAITPITGTVRKTHYWLTQLLQSQARCTLGGRAGARVM